MCGVSFLSFSLLVYHTAPLLISQHCFASDFVKVDGCCVLMLCCSFLIGKTYDTEETVLTDHIAGSAGKRELPEREKQLAHHAAEGENIF